MLLSLAVLFFAPIIMQSIVIPETSSTITYAQEEMKPVWREETIRVVKPTSRILFLFTHSQESYPGASSSKGDSLPVYHPTNNITAFHPTIEQAFLQHSFSSEHLSIDTMQLLSKQNKGFDQSYDVIRPYVQDAVTKSSYDYVLDFHRDSAKRKVTTLTTPEKSYAKLMFIVGGEHERYAENLKLAEQLSRQLEKQLPGISRGVLVKKGRGVDGVYNQDLHPGSVLIELGGIENTTPEIEASLQELAKAFRNMH